MIRILLPIALAMAIGTAVVIAGAATAQDSPGGPISMVLPVPVEEYVTTRKALMIVNDDAMYEMETALMNNTVDMNLLPLRASAIAAELRAFATLFPAESNYIVLGNPPNPDVMTSASPMIWENMEAFQAELHAVADLAEEASYAGTVEEFAPLVAQLREACTQCHTNFLHYEEVVTQ
jgi:cytochrome c556